MSFQYPNSKLLIFAKAPIAGQVKTRLQPALTPSQCAQFHEHLVTQTLITATKNKLCPVELWCAGDLEHPFLNQCQSHFQLTLQKQSGSDLGERMANALSHTLNTAQSTLIIGCDCPSLTSEHLVEACQALQQHDVVVIPAEDGGYVLIGSQKDRPKIFHNIDWGSEKVMQQTRRNLQQSDLKSAELETLWDIDRPNDLKRLALIPHHANWLKQNNIKLI